MKARNIDEDSQENVILSVRGGKQNSLVIQVVMGVTMGRFFMGRFYRPFFWDNFLHCCGNRRI